MRGSPLDGFWSDVEREVDKVIRKMKEVRSEQCHAE